MSFILTKCCTEVHTLLKYNVANSDNKSPTTVLGSKLSWYSLRQILGFEFPVTIPGEFRIYTLSKRKSARRTSLQHSICLYRMKAIVN